MEAPAPQAEPAETKACSRAALALQVLGSGGPIPDDGRASSGYLVWQSGRARVLVDVGGGVFLRFGEAGAKVADLDVVAITHLHADHVADLSAILKGGYFAHRERPLVILGPTGDERFPAIDEHLTALLDPKTGAFRYLAGYLTGDGLFLLEPRALAADATEPTVVFDADGLRIEAVGVHHGVIPAVGYVVELGGKRIAFGGDQSADNAAFEAMAKGVDLLVAHHALPEHGAEGVRHLHRIPSEIGALATQAEAKRLVLSHNMLRALDDLDGGLAAIRAAYAGPVDVATDLSCYVLSP